MVDGRGVVTSGPGLGSICSFGASGHGSTVRGAPSVESASTVAGAADADGAADAEAAAIADAGRDGPLAVSQLALTTAIDTATAMQNQTPDGVRDERTMSSSSMWTFIHERGFAADRLGRDRIIVASAAA
jgi:hypothetical protein